MSCVEEDKERETSELCPRGTHIRLGVREASWRRLWSEDLGVYQWKKRLKLGKKGRIVVLFLLLS